MSKCGKSKREGICALPRKTQASLRSHGAFYRLHTTEIFGLHLTINTKKPSLCTNIALVPWYMVVAGDLHLNHCGCWPPRRMCAQSSCVQRSSPHRSHVPHMGAPSHPILEPLRGSFKQLSPLRVVTLRQCGNVLW